MWEEKVCKKEVPPGIDQGQEGDKFQKLREIPNQFSNVGKQWGRGEGCSSQNPAFGTTSGKGVGGFEKRNFLRGNVI